MNQELYRISIIANGYLVHFPFGFVDDGYANDEFAPYSEKFVNTMVKAGAKLNQELHKDPLLEKLHKDNESSESTQDQSSNEQPIASQIAQKYYPEKEMLNSNVIYCATFPEVLELLRQKTAVTETKGDFAIQA